MKRLFAILFLFVSCKSISQTFLPPRSSATTTVQDSRWRALLTMYMPHTRGLTLNGGLDTLGAVIYDDSSAHIWYRDTVPSGGHKWSMILKTGDAGQGTLTQLNTGLGLTGGPITTTGTIVVDTSYNANGLSHYFIRIKDSTTAFVTPTQMNAQGFLKTVAGIALGGDLAGSTLPNPVIAANAVSFGKFQQIPGFTFVANPTASPANTQASYFKYGLIWNNDSLKVDTNLLKTVFGAATTPTGITQLTGDVVAGPGFGSQGATIGNNKVTYGKFQQAPQQGLLGATAAGNYQHIIVGLNLFMSGDTLNAIGGGGGGNPLVNNGAGYRLVEPISGGNYPINSLVCAGCTLDSTSHSGSLTITVSGGGGGNTNSNIGSGYRFAIPSTNNIKTLFCSGCTLDSTTNANALTLTVTAGGSGTVTSIAQTVPASLLTIGGSPITTSGTLAIGLANAGAHSYWGNNTGSSGTPLYVTNTQLTADLNLFTTTLQGLVPLSGGGTTNFLRADGTWAAPAGGGSTNVNIGSGYRWAVPGTNNIKTLFCSGCTLDSTTNTNALTLTVTAGGSGTVTSIAQTVPTSLLTISGSPITTSGTLAIGLATAPANDAFGNFTGSTATPAYGKLPLAAMATNTANSLTGYDNSGNPGDVTIGLGLQLISGVLTNSAGVQLPVFNVKAPPYNAKGDGQVVNDAVMNSSSNAIASTQATFVSGDVGKVAYMKGVGAGAFDSVGTITGFTDAHHITVSFNASTTNSHGIFRWGTNDTHAFQTAISDAANAGTVVVPNGLYIIAGPLIHSDNLGYDCNAQIFIPAQFPLPANNPKVIGQTPPLSDFSALAYDSSELFGINQGAILFSALTANYGQGSVIGSSAPRGTGYGAFNLSSPVFENIMIEIPDGPQGSYRSGLNLQNVIGEQIKNCIVKTDVWQGVTHAPVYPTVGFASTKSNGGVEIFFDGVNYSQGFYAGYQIGEHTTGFNMQGSGNKYCVLVNGSAHAFNIGTIKSQWNQNDIYISVDHSQGWTGAFGTVAQLDVEALTDTCGGTKWYNHQYVINDSANDFHASIGYWFVSGNAICGSAQSDYAVNGGSFVQMSLLGDQLIATHVMSGGSLSQTQSNGLGTVLGKSVFEQYSGISTTTSMGTPVFVQSSNQTATSQPVFQRLGINRAISGAEQRLFQEDLITNTATNNAKIFESLVNAGTFFTYLTADGTTTTLGQALNLSGYAGGSPSGTIAYYLGVDVSGNVLLGTPGGGGGSQTLAATQNATSYNLAISGGNNQNFLTATGSLAGLLDTARAKFIDSLKNGLKTFNIYAANGLTGAAGDSFYLGGSFNQNTTLNTNGFTFSITNLPNKATALSTDSVLLMNLAGQLFKLPVPSGGGGSGTVTSVATGLGLSGGTITTTGTLLLDTSYAVTKSSAQTISGAKIFTASTNVNAAFATNSTVNLTGITNTAGGSTFKVLAQDTSTGKVWNIPYYKTDTTGYAAGNSTFRYNGTNIVLGRDTSLSWADQTITGNRTINIGAHELTLIGGTGTTNGIWFTTSVYQTSPGIADANLTITDGSLFYDLDPILTASRTITLPSSSSDAGRILFIHNYNPSFTWTFASTVSYLDGTIVTTLAPNTIYTVQSIGSQWFITNSFSGSSNLRYQHTIFTPSTGGTVALVNNQYNIIKPSASLATLTVNLPSSPLNNDVVYIKFTQTVSVVTYGNGTVVDGITAPVAGGLVVLTFDSTSSSWY